MSFYHSKEDGWVFACPACECTGFQHENWCQTCEGRGFIDGPIAKSGFAEWYQAWLEQNGLKP